MKRLITLFTIFLFLLVGGLTNSFGFYTQVGKQDNMSVVKEQATKQDFKYGTEGQTALKSEGADIVKQGNSVLLSGGSDSAGVASVFFLFRADRNAAGFNIVVDYHGDGQVEIIDQLLSIKESPRSYIFPVNGADSNNGKRVIHFSEPVNRVTDVSGDIEIHISVGSGKCMTLNSVSIEYVYQPENRVEVKKEVRVVNRYYGVLPPGWSYSVLSYYHRGPIWVWVGNGYVVYDGWWYALSYTEWVRFYYPTPVYRYYYHYCGEPYVAEKHIYVHRGGSRGDRRDFAPERKSPERVRSVVVKPIERRAPATLGVSTDTSKNLLQNGSDRSKIVINREDRKSVQPTPAEIKGAKRLSREAITGLMQQGHSSVRENRPQVVAADRQQRTQQEQVQWTQKERSGGVKAVRRIFESAVNAVFDTGTRSNSGISSAPANNGGGENVSQKRRAVAEARTQPTQQVQAAPARSETRQVQSSSTSSSSDDEQNKKHRRDR
ncbi:MAG: hypothetical protein PHW31_04430 [Candidatus Pacebacteria bacterium]|nr:hypothetical protein [Candidatus Paceibacterota bacterium]